MVTLVRATRPNKRYPKVAPQITYVHKWGLKWENEIKYYW
jgi:hypothetical protein